VTKEDFRDRRRYNGRDGKDSSGTGEGHVWLTHAVPTLTAATNPSAAG